MIPTELREWEEWARRLSTTTLFYEEDFEKAALALPENVVGELEKFYEKAVREDHLALLNAWLSLTEPVVPMCEDEKAIRNLLLLFAQIGQTRDSQPFNDYELDNDKLIPPKPDWSKLPPGFEFLAEAAELCSKFSYVFSEDFRDDVDSFVTPEEKRSLTEVAARLRRAGCKIIDDWRRRLGISEHVEAMMVFRLIGVMDALDLQYYD